MNMERCTGSSHILDDMDEKELLSILHDALNTLGSLDSLAPSSPPLPVVFPAEQEVNSYPQTDQYLSGYSGCTSLGAAPHSVEPPSSLSSTAGTYSEGQNYIHPQIYQTLSGYGGCSLLGAALLNSGQTAPTLCPGPQNAMQPATLYSQTSAYGQEQYNNVLSQSLLPVVVLNGELVYGLPAALPPTPTFAAPPPPVSTFNSKKRKREDGNNSQPYVKKPPNAFMLFMKEQRPNYASQMKIGGTAGINKILGEKWNSMSDKEQEKYFEEAHRLRRLHAQQHPNWSANDNYGRKRKRDRSKASTMTGASTSTSGSFTQPAKKMCVNPSYTCATETPHVQSNVMESSTSTTGMTQTPHIQSNVMESSTSRTDVTQTPHIQSNVMESSTSRTDVTQTPHIQSNVMESSTSTTDVTQTPHIQSNVMESSTSTTDVTQTPHIQSNVMESSTSRTDVTQTPHIQSNVMASSIMPGVQDSSAVGTPHHSQLTQLPTSEAAESQTTLPDNFDWLEGTIMELFKNLHEPPSHETLSSLLAEDTCEEELCELLC